MQSGEPGVCSSSSIFVSLSGCFKNTELPSGSERIWCSWLARLSVLVLRNKRLSVLARVWSVLHSKYSCALQLRSGADDSKLVVHRAKAHVNKSWFVLTVFDVVRVSGRESGMLKQCCS